MKTFLLTVGLVLILVVLVRAVQHHAEPPPAPPGPATIRVNTRATTLEVSPLLFGATVEWTENGNRIFDPAAGKLRTDILDALRPLRITVWRFPGGILSDHYVWRSGVGPLKARPKAENPMDRTIHENNFGTDEFIAFCRDLQAEPLITANFGSGTLDNTLEWQKYFAAQGFPVRYWEIGNEIYLAEKREHATIPGNDQRIFKTSAEYAAGFKTWAAALRKADSNVKVGAIAATYNAGKEHRDWLDHLVNDAHDDADFVALHNSYAPLVMGSYSFGDDRKRRLAYQAMFAQPAFVAEDIRKVEERYGAGKKPAIAITEHFPLFGGGGSQKQMLEILDQSRTQAAALYTASLFHTYMREHVWMANYNIAVSKWFGALLTDSDTGLVKTPTYYVFDLYRNHFGDRLHPAEVKGDTYNSTAVGMTGARENVPYLDAVSTSDAGGNLYLAVINRNLFYPVEAALEFDGSPAASGASALTLAGPGADSINGSSLSSSTKANGHIAEAPSQAAAANGRYTFPAASVTILKWPPFGAASERNHVVSH
jgi:alpha-N-arabinofuranosidase